MLPIFSVLHGDLGLSHLCVGELNFDREAGWGKGETLKSAKGAYRMARLFQ